MTQQQARMINEAIRRTTGPDGTSKISWCPKGMFKVYEFVNQIWLYYNDENGSTHTIKEDINNG